MAHKSLKIHLIMTLGTLIIFLSVMYMTARFCLPSDIVIRTGESSTLDFLIPLKGVLLCDDTAVSAVNDKPVEGNINTAFISPITLKAEKAGRALIRFSFIGIPIKSSTVTVIPDTSLVPCGQAVGLEMNTDGILVLGTGEVRTQSGRYVSPCSNILKSGDLIKKADDITLTSKEDLISCIENGTKPQIDLEVERNGTVMDIAATPVVSSESHKRKLGVWVRDSTQGIGTVTCYDEKGNFYALGHPVTDVDTGSIMKIRNGKIMPVGITSVNKGKRGDPGELLGSTDRENIIGSIYVNTECGIKGKLDRVPALPAKKCKIALKPEVRKGKASILVTTEGTRAKAYDIDIENTDTLSMDHSKAMVIRITDKELINKTGGIVQGMSGAPIIQDGRLVGAVTHVFIQDPTKGYGIYIEDMLKAAG